jgi:hypothetical protein
MQDGRDGQDGPDGQARIGWMGWMGEMGKMAGRAGRARLGGPGGSGPPARRARRARLALPTPLDSRPRRHHSQCSQQDAPGGGAGAVGRVYPVPHRAGPFHQDAKQEEDQRPGAGADAREPERAEEREHQRFGDVDTCGSAQPAAGVAGMREPHAHGFPEEKEGADERPGEEERGEGHESRVAGHGSRVSRPETRDSRLTTVSANPPASGCPAP